MRSGRQRGSVRSRSCAIRGFGASAVVVDLLVRTASIAALLDRGGALVTVTVAGALGRAAILPLAAVLPYARPGGGLSDRIGLRATIALLGSAETESSAQGRFCGALDVGLS